MPARTFIAPQRQPLIFLALLAAILVHYALGWPWALPLWGLALFLVWLFRDPSRLIPSVPLAVVSPADGRVVAVEPGRDPFLQRDAVRIGILMDWKSVFFTRSPIEGKVLKVWYTPGGTLPSSHEAAASQNQRVAFWIQTDEGDDVVLVLIAGPLARPRCYVNTGMRLGQGQRCGFIPLGSRVDVLLPANVRVAVQPGERVKAGSTIIATLVHK